MKKILTLSVILTLAFFYLTYYVYAAPITCSDSDADASHPFGDNVYVRGVCRDESHPNGYPSDSCVDFTTLREWECYHCTEPYCREVDRLCTYGCVDGRCQTYKELTKGLKIPKKGVFCIDGDGPDYPNLPPLKELGCGLGNNRNDFSKQSFCIDRIGIHLDTCESGTVADYYCNDAGYCIPSYVWCSGGCLNGKCKPNVAKKGFCLNPGGNSCTKTFEDVCCPDNKMDYGKPNGPKSKEDCEQNFFVAGEPNPIQKSKCKIICCCELYYDDKNNKQADANLKYKINCQGEDDAILEPSNCNKETCLNHFKNLPNKINSRDNTWINSIKEGRTCRAGQCASGLLCLPDIQDESMKVCCKSGSCVLNKKCVLEGTKASKEDNGVNKDYICEGSKWILMEKPKKQGCSFFLGSHQPPDMFFGLLVLALMFKLVMMVNVKAFNLD